jgi:hypothetical protein
MMNVRNFGVAVVHHTCKIARTSRKEEKERLIDPGLFYLTGPFMPSLIGNSQLDLAKTEALDLAKTEARHFA